MSYILGTGYVSGPGREEFCDVWRENFHKHYPKEDPSRVVVISNGNAPQPLASVGYRVQWINLSGNLGHIGDLISGRKQYPFCGWTMAVCALALIAYSDESDLIYREQDCLCFGDWVGQMYLDLGSGDMVFGGPMATEPFMECAQSLFLVRHQFIPQFVTSMLVQGDERRKDSCQKEDNLPERKFHRIRESFGDRIRHLSFGVDRERPLPFDAPVWYAQKFTSDEMALMREKCLI